MPKEPNKPKILFIASNIPTPKRKSNRVVMTIAHKLSDQFEVAVLHPAEWAPFPINLMKKYKNIAGNESWEDNGIIVKPFKYIRLFGSRNAFKLLPYYKNRIQDYCQLYGEPQIVHAHYVLPDGYLAYQISISLGIPYIISFRKSDIKLLQTKKSCCTYKMMRLVLSHAHQIIVHNAAQQEFLSDAGFESTIIPHGIDKDFLSKKENENNSGHLNIATIGELIPQKHIDWVINSVKNYKGNKTLSLTIAGDGPMRQKLKSLAQGNNDIVFLGKISHDKIDKLLCQSDIFALPSHNETFGLVYIEATAHQNAVIATKGTGIWGHFIDGEEMHFCDSYTSFQEMLYKLIDNDNFRNQMALKAFVKTKENFTWDAVINKYVSLYNSILTQPNF